MSWPFAVEIIYGIAEQIVAYLGQARGIATAERFGEGGLDGDAARGCERTNEFDASSDDGGEVTFVPAQELLARVEARQSEE
jgi:hypothetical protein